MKKILSLMVVLALMTACGGDEDEALVSDPDVEIGTSADQTFYYVGGDSAFVYGSPEPLRFVSSIACIDSCVSQTASFSYDDESRLSRMDFTQTVSGQQSRRTTLFQYGADRISYRTRCQSDSTVDDRTEWGYVLLDKRGRAARGSQMKWTKDSWSGKSFSIFDVPAEVCRLQQQSRDENWIKCVTDYEYRYGDENDLLQVNQHSRQGNRESSERSDLTWDVGNLALISDTHADCSCQYGQVPNKTNLDLNRYMAYAFAQYSDCTDELLGLLGVYGNRSAQLCAEYTDQGTTFRLHYDLDDDGYVTRIRAERQLHEDLYGVNSHTACDAWDRMGFSGETPSAAGTDSIETRNTPSGATQTAPKVRSQQRTFTVTYQ